ncbi:MAG: N-formylglutamate amidohydrolase [Ardenticatenaceae bacterium]|nr:N-formylglutamate amidohydrolase [Ardenticatenaceae bacterium]
MTSTIAHQADGMMAQLLALETAVSPIQPPPPNEPCFTHVPGSTPILLSAPHSASHWRNGRLKKEEGFTAAIVRYVAARTGAHAFYTHYQSARDPNWHKEAPYKQALKQILNQHPIHFVLDIHGMSNRHKIGLALGTINGRSCPPDHERHIVHTLVSSGFAPTTSAQARQLTELDWLRFVVNHPRFTGGVTSHTVTRFVSQDVGIPAAQLELCTLLRVVPAAYQDYEGLWGGVTTAVTTLITLVQTLPHC